MYGNNLIIIITKQSEDNCIFSTETAYTCGWEKNLSALTTKREGDDCFAAHCFDGVWKMKGIYEKYIKKKTEERTR